LVVSKIFNISVAKGFVPDAWRHAIVTPLPKSFPVKQNGDLRPLLLLSTTGALIDITYKVSLLLESKEFVRCILVDFSKAFDTVDHSQLIGKLR